MTPAELEAAGEQLIALGAIFDPKDAAVAGAVLKIVAGLNNAIHAFAANDPAAWKALQADAAATVAEWKASIAR